MVVIGNLKVSKVNKGVRLLWKNVNLKLLLKPVSMLVLLLFLVQTASKFDANITLDYEEKNS